MDTIIKIENLSFSYADVESEKENTALKNISLEVKKGEYISVLGHNGSGKSTLAKIIMGITPRYLFANIRENQGIKVKGMVSGVNMEKVIQEIAKEKNIIYVKI